jgi:hypothetical protein
MEEPTGRVQAEWTRTATDREVHKTLNLIRPRHIRPPASRLSVVSGFPDVADTSDKMTCAKDVPRRTRAEYEPPEVALSIPAQGCGPADCSAPCPPERVR